MNQVNVFEFIEGILSLKSINWIQTYNFKELYLNYLHKIFNYLFKHMFKTVELTWYTTKTLYEIFQKSLIDNQ